MSTRILWLDNDQAALDPMVRAVRRAGYDVEFVTRLGEAWRRLEEEPFHLLILDVMIPTTTAEEEVQFPPAETDSGHLSGLCFYRKMQEGPIRSVPAVLVFTIRQDAQTVESFKREGLPEPCFARRSEILRSRDFLNKIREVIQLHHDAAAAAPQR